MFTTAVISFREFFEAFLLIGIFLGVSNKLHLKKEWEITIASVVGVLLSLAVAAGTYLLIAREHTFLTEKKADNLESYLLIFSGFFIAYIVLSLHKSLGKHSKTLMDKANKKMEKDIFDMSVFLMVVFIILREGFEIAFFTAGTSFVSTFTQNILGLLAGFLISSFFGGMVFFAYTKLSLGKIFKFTEYAIILVGASLLQIGITKLFATQFTINLSNMLPLHLQFLPSEDSLLGNVLQSFLGIDRNFSLVRLVIIVLYVWIVYLFYMKKRVNKIPIKAPTGLKQAKAL